MNFKTSKKTKKVVKLVDEKSLTGRHVYHIEDIRIAKQMASDYEKLSGKKSSILDFLD